MTGRRDRRCRCGAGLRDGRAGAAGRGLDTGRRAAARRLRLRGRDDQRRAAGWLALGGAATVLVAAVPLDGDASTPAGHTVAATVAFLSLAAWPALAGPGPKLLRPPVSRAAAAALLGLVGWLFIELSLDGDRVGLVERVAAGAQAVWPLAVVVGARAGRARRGALS